MSVGNNQDQAGKLSSTAESEGLGSSDFLSQDSLGLATLPASCQNLLATSGKLEALRDALQHVDAGPPPEALKGQLPLAFSASPEKGGPPPLCSRLIEAYFALEEQSRRSLTETSHELKTPLAIMAGYIELLLTQKVGPLTDRQRRILEDTKASCARLQQFIQDFLAYRKLEASKLSLKLERGDLNACLAELFSYWSAQFQKKGVALYHHVHTKLRPFKFDYPKIQQVVSNLLQNSLKFTPQGGTVWLSAEPYQWERRGARILVSKEKRKRSGGLPNSVRLTVADTGPGIPPEYQQEVFNDFKIHLADQPWAGTGLGLAIARRLVQAHSGKIWLESEPEAGCKISFLLPINPVEKL